MATLLASRETQGDDIDGLSVDSGEHEAEPLEVVAWHFHELQDFGH